MIQIQEPHLEALIQERMTAGGFASVEDALCDALTTAPAPERKEQRPGPRTGAELLAALQDSPFYGLDIDFDSYRRPLPVRDIEL